MFLSKNMLTILGVIGTRPEAIKMAPILRALNYNLPQIHFIVFVAALTAFYHRIKFAHVEAGLRTGSLNHPFPEELNRRYADSVSALYFAPTPQNRANLLNEQIPDAKIIVTGNTGIDALLWAADLPYDWNSGPLAHLPTEQQIVLVTAHRRENFGAPSVTLRCNLPVAMLLQDPLARAQMVTPTSPFGDGHAAARIVSALIAH